MDTKNPIAAQGGADDRTFWAWDQYWRDGRLASCGGEGGAAYQAAITEGWREFFRTLPDGSRILDVCTGNGAVARVAEETARERGIRFEIEAFDGAVIARSGSGSMIHFRSRVRAESLPYPDASFDVVVGQYGLEYTDLERSLPELARVSAPGCRVRFMTHAREGVVVEHARHQLEDARQVLDGPLFPAARVVVDACADGASEDDLRTVTRSYNDAVRRMEEASRDSVEPAMYSNACCVLTHALSIQRQAGSQAVMDKIDDVEATVHAHAERLRAMTRAALDESGAQALSTRIGKLWGQEMAMSAGRRAEGDLLGWIIESAG